MIWSKGAILPCPASAAVVWPAELQLDILKALFSTKSKILSPKMWCGMLHSQKRKKRRKEGEISCLQYTTRRAEQKNNFVENVALMLTSYEIYKYMEGEIVRRWGSGSIYIARQSSKFSWQGLLFRTLRICWCPSVLMFIKTPFLCYFKTIFFFLISSQIIPQICLT